MVWIFFVILLCLELFVIWRIFKSKKWRRVRRFGLIPLLFIFITPLFKQPIISEGFLDQIIGFIILLFGLIIMILGWVGSMAQKKKQEALKLEEYLQSTKEQQKITINSSLFKFCTECGTKNKHEYKYCLMCGKKI